MTQAALTLEEVADQVAKTAYWAVGDNAPHEVASWNSDAVAAKLRRSPLWRKYAGNRDAKIDLGEYSPYLEHSYCKGSE